VVKLGGSLLEDDAGRAAVLAAVARRWQRGEPLVVVHGGGKRIDAELAARGIPRRVHQGLRITDAATLAVVVGVLAGTMNRALVRELAARGADAVGVSAADGATLRADLHPPVGGVDLGFVGAVASSDPSRLETHLAAGRLPVVAPLASGPGGGPLNVNADAAAAALAGGLAAGRLVFLTDVEGVTDDAGRVREILDASETRRLLDGPAVSGGMRPKLAACLAAVRAGVREIVIAGPERREAALAGGLGGTVVVAA
jgi:acetylglutamate kinase